MEWFPEPLPVKLYRARPHVVEVWDPADGHGTVIVRHGDGDYQPLDKGLLDARYEPLL